jgi:predicted  nucleic acid-binding Zn-ribbon protein
MKKAVWVAMASVLLTAGCGGDRAERERLARQLADAERRAHEARVELERMRQQKEELSAAIARVNKELMATITSESAAQDELVEARSEKERLARNLAKAKDTSGPVLESAKTVETLTRNEKALKEWVAVLNAELAQARSERDALQQKIGPLETASRDVQAKLAAKDQEHLQAMARVAVVEQQLRDRQVELEKERKARESALPSPSAEDGSRRSAYGKRELVYPGLMFPVWFNARAGETLRWSWKLLEVPADLPSDAVEFFVVGPDGARAFSGRGGGEKRSDEVGFKVPADGRWTLVWANRHTAMLIFQYSVIVVPAK